MSDSRWHVGAMNDAVFIIDSAPRPSNDDVVLGADCRAVSPAIDERAATAIVAAHNEVVDRLKAELSSLRSHYDRAAPEHNLLALLDLYKGREEEAVAEVERLRLIEQGVLEMNIYDRYAVLGQGGDARRGAIRRGPGSHRLPPQFPGGEVRGGCKHENATGYMWRENIGASKHIIPVRWEYAFTQPGKVGHHHRITCDDCGAWLPLGSSDETDPRVAVEIRAAELAQSRTSESVLEWAGWQSHAEDYAVTTAQGAAGWLAREIHHHDTAIAEHGEGM